ncbi:hypothetical protein TCAL_11644 [Tigriopus californicus]|uniref:TOG domain-containing protein n=1 Tax=Tigriopus californicus TaxID=6832 RepID=A0A553PI16_TIGCA|nr:mucin-17-like [Tigriopus californicus]TRY77320.1 hypothetical protein TCAL_11644 [Tigriopus californicus]|eukprot:TCALIF_11644-PA protein Name:"Similar to Ppp4r4 Serine/threonine-protein phosphatase 4 regulatory subunit 4 (Mus musculus)" AED:0.32 eAED:0.33 QI:0/-1/0/1/-1/1/1/0/1868
MAPISDNNSNGDESDGGEGGDTDTVQDYHHLHYGDIKKPVLMEDPVKDQAFLSMVNRANSSPPLVLPPKKISPPPYSVRYSTSLLSSSSIPSTQSSTGSSSEYPSYLATVPPPPPPQYTPMGYPGLYSSVSQGSTSDSSSVDFSTSDSFTNTFLRGILTSIDSKDPVVAHAWLETLLDAIDLLPPEAIKREIVVIAISKGQLSQSVASRKSSCRLLGKIATKLDQLTVQQEVLPTTLALCQDPEPEVRFCMCRHVGFVSRGVGLDITKAAILPQLVELSNDEKSQVRLAAIETVVHLLSLLDDETCTQIIVPLVIKSCEQAKHLEDESLPSIAHFLGRLCHGLTPNLKNEQKKWFIDFYSHLSLLGVQSSIDESGKPMPDIVPIPDKASMYNACRRECAFNFPAMVLFIGPQNFPTLLYPIFNNLACDSSPQVRKTLASSLHEVAKLIGNSFSVTKNQISNLFADNNVEVLEAMVTNLVHVIDALARFGVLQFGQSGQYSDELSSALLKCERLVSQTRNWRLHADCLEKFSCLANCISSLTIQSKFIPMLFERMLKARPLPCRTAAARTLLVILRFTIKMEDRTHIMYRIKEELAHSKNCHTRMLFLRLCEMSIALFSRNYFKQHFFHKLLCLSQDSVPNLRLKLCSLLPKLKSLLYLPSDRSLLHHLEDTVKELLLHEQDRDVLSALQIAIDELDRTEMGVDGVPSMDAELDRENDRKLREERLIYSMEEQMNKIYSVEASPNHKRSPSRIGEDNNGSQYSSSHGRWADLTDSRRRSESLPPNLSRTTGNRTEILRLETNEGKHLVGKGRFDSPEPSQTYSPDVSLSFRDPVSAVMPSVNRVANPWVSKSAMSSGMSTTTSITSGSAGSSLIPQSSLDQNGSTGIPAAYSMSLENLDPSAKEFLVDAGVTLETTNLLSSASSLPNLTKIDQNGIHGDILSKSNSQGSALHKPLEGEFSKFMISSEEMMKYEAEYKKASMEIANQDAAVKAAFVSITATSSEPTKPKSVSNGLVTTASSSVSRIPSSLPTRQSRSETKTRILSSPSRAPPKSHLIVNKDAICVSTSPSTPSSLSKPTTPNLANQRPNSMSAPGPTAGTSGLPKFSFTGKFSSSTDKLQDSFERLAEKWEAKRKNLVNVSTTNAVAYSGSGSALSDETQSSGLSSSDVPSRRSSVMEHKLQTIKQHNIPKRTSLIKAPVQKRLSLSDQMGLVGRQAMERFILPKRKSVNMEVAYDEDGPGGNEKALVTTSGESEDEETISNRSNKSSDEDLPPYPNNSNSGSASALPLPPPPTAEIFDDGMSTYVPPPQTMNSTQRSQSHLVVKPLTSTIPSRFPSKLSFASSSLRHDSQVPRSRDIGTSDSSTEAMIVPSLPSQRPSLPRPKQQPYPRESSLGNYNNNPREPSRSTPTNNPPLLHMHSAPSINLRSHNSPTNRREKQFEETITPANQTVPRSGGIATPDVSGVEGSSFVPKFTRLPPPKYRPQPPASRRPHSQQDQYLERGNQASNVVKQHQAKSLSAESILDSNHHQMDGKGSSLGNVQHQSRDGQIRQNSQNTISSGRFSSPNIKRLSQNSTNSDGSSRSSSPHTGVGHQYLDSKSPSSPDSLEEGLPSPDKEKPPITIANSIVTRRAASGMRMWSNPARGTRIASSTESPATRGMKGSPSRSPSPRGHVPEPAPSSPSGNGSLTSIARPVQSKLRRPMASSMSHLPPPSTALNSPRRLAQRNSYGGGPMSAQSSPVKSTYSMIPSQRSNVSSSAGNSRANSPPEQRRRSSHYPNGSSGSQGPTKYGGGHQTSNLPRYPRFQHQSQPQLTTSQSGNRGRPTSFQQPAVSSQSRIPPPTENQSNLKQPRVPVRGRSSLLAPGFSHRN